MRLESEPEFLVQVLPDRPPDHLSVECDTVHVEAGLTLTKEALASRRSQVQELVPRLDRDVADLAVPVDTSARHLLQVVAVEDDDFLPLHLAGLLHVEFDSGTDGAPPTARREKPDVRPVS